MHEIDYEIVGDDLQAVVVELDPGEAVLAEAGAMLWMEDATRMNTGTEGGIFSGLKRVITGESFFITSFLHAGSAARVRVAFAAPYPGRIVPLDMEALGGRMLCQKDAFLCAAKGTDISVAFTKRLGAGLFGGEGLFLATLRGPGRVYLQSLPLSRLADRLVAAVGRNKGEHRGVGGLGGGLLKGFISGD